MRTERQLPPPVEAIRRRSSADQVAAYIRFLIFEGALRPGDRVPQDDVADALSLSRIPVREALIALEREGWVRIEVNRGAFINALDADAVRDSYELFGLVYGFATQRALARSSPGLVDELAVIERELRKADDPDDVHRLALAFHNTIVDGARSPRVKVVLRAMTGLVAGNFFEKVPGSIGVERRGTAAVMRALRKGDGDRAASEYARMMRRQGDLVVKLFEERGLFAFSG